MPLQPWTHALNKATMNGMRVDNPDHGRHDHGFGHGAHEPELHDVDSGSDQVGHDTGADHGLVDSIGHGSEAGLAAALGGHVDGGHVEVGHLDHDFGHDGLHEGLDGLHDSVHHSLGLGFEGDEHHSLHEGLHEGLHDAAHDPQHDQQHDVQHHDTGLGDLFHI